MRTQAIIVCLFYVAFRIQQYAAVRISERKPEVLGPVTFKFDNDSSLPFNYASGSFQQVPLTNGVSSIHPPPLNKKNPNRTHKHSPPLSSTINKLPKESKKHKKKAESRTKLRTSSDHSSVNATTSHRNKNKKHKEHSKACTDDKHHSHSTQRMHSEPISLQINVQIELSRSPSSSTVAFQRPNKRSRARRKSLGKHGWVHGTTIAADTENTHLKFQPVQIDSYKSKNLLRDTTSFIHLYLPVSLLNQARGHPSRNTNRDAVLVDSDIASTTAMTTTSTPRTRTKSPSTPSTVGARTHASTEFPRFNNKPLNKHSYAKTQAPTARNGTSELFRCKKHPNSWMAASQAQIDELQRLFTALDEVDTRAWSTWFQCAFCLSTENEALPAEVGLKMVQNAKLSNDVRTVTRNLDSDSCGRWLECERSAEPIITRIFSQLPSCPCMYPSQVVYKDRIYDSRHRRHFRWRDVNLETERLDVYRPGAAYCIRSLTPIDKAGLAAQQCCYDQLRKLLTRGWGAGTPSLVSIDVSKPLYYAIDRKPWLACKGDFTKFHLQRTPSNHLNCSANPTDEVFQQQVLLATNY